MRCKKLSTNLVVEHLGELNKSRNRSGRKSAPFLCFQKSNILVNCGSADVADPRQFRYIQLLSLVGGIVAEKTCGDILFAYLRTPDLPPLGSGICHAPLLEKHGMRVEVALLFDRSTQQRSEHGVIDWSNMFVTKPFEGIDENTKKEILAETENALRGQLLIDGKWYIDYVRIRIRARKVNP